MIFIGPGRPVLECGGTAVVRMLAPRGRHLFVSGLRARPVAQLQPLRMRRQSSVTITSGRLAWPSRDKFSFQATWVGSDVTRPAYVVVAVVVCD